MITFPGLRIDRDDDGPDTLILLEQDHHDGEGVHWVEMHPAQLKEIAERLNLSAPDADAKRTIARLGRQLRILLARMDQLDDWLNLAALHGREDLQNETTFSLATLELAREFVQDLPEEQQAQVPSVAAPSRVTHTGQQQDNTTQSGGLKDPQERGASSGHQASLLVGDEQ